MLNITTFLDANACRLDKNVLYNPKTNEKYNSHEILAMTSEIARDLKNCGIKKGDRICQLILQKVEICEWEEVDNLEDLDITNRGIGGFGSTGKQ